MDSELLSRFLFFFTSSFHFIYPPISMGLGLLIVVMGAIYLRRRDPLWRQMSFFWVRIFGLVFAMGIATGIVQEFEFGTNWANYSRFVGNIFGSLLAAEGIFAFFLEGGFLGLLLFGGTRLGPRMWLLSASLVALGAHFSALWILMANSWMQTPAGYTLQAVPFPPRAVMTSFMDVVFTPSFIPRLLHVWVASWLVGATLVLSVSAWYILKKKHTHFAQASFKLALPVFAVLSILQLTVFGAESAISVVDNQPLKLAAMEGVWESRSCAPMYIMGWVNEKTQTNIGLTVPCLLSFLAHQDFQATIQGLKTVTPDLWPPVNLTFQSYHLMINLGGVFIPIGLLGVALYLWKQRIWTTKWLLWIFVISIVLTELSTMSGWWTAEFGRQPWIVYNLMRTSEAISPNLSPTQAIFSVVMFVVLYGILFALFIYLLNEKIQHGPDASEDFDQAQMTSLPDTFRDIFSRRARA
jgi:cytochrome d ubiquinol oxidase subunit I